MKSEWFAIRELPKVHNLCLVGADEFSFLSGRKSLHGDRFCSDPSRGELGLNIFFRTSSSESWTQNFRVSNPNCASTW